MSKYKKVENRFTVLEHDGIELVAWDELKEKMDAIEYESFTHWMRGQTCHPVGAYVWDVERFISGNRTILD